MDPIVSERLLKFGSSNMMAFYVDACKEHLKYPSLSLAEVMCVYGMYSNIHHRCIKYLIPYDSLCELQLTGSLTIIGICIVLRRGK